MTTIAITVRFVQPLLPSPNSNENATVDQVKDTSLQWLVLVLQLSWVTLWLGWVGGKARASVLESSMQFLFRRVIRILRITMAPFARG